MFISLSTDTVVKESKKKGENNVLFLFVSLNKIHLTPYLA